MITQESTLTLNPPLRRRIRTKLRKPKYLRLHLISAAPPPMPTAVNHQKQLINLFPLHPENKLDDQEHNMANIFSSCDDVDGGAATLTGILSSGEEEEEYGNNPSPSSVNYADEEVELVRTAMRKNCNYNYNYKRDCEQDLKWVHYSDVMMVRGLSSSSSSSTSTPSSYHHHHVNHHNDGHDHGSKLVLKLDYEKIMNSWVNKGPLYINNDKSNPDIQTVPELQEDDFIPLNGLTHCERENGGNEGSWTVPEMVSNDTGGGDETNAMIHRREASVQRYKEKRRNRLFAKTIRYQVRKLNAEKRPRIKGRFVKRN